MRLSVHLFNTAAQIDDALDALHARSNARAGNPLNVPHVRSTTGSGDVPQRIGIRHSAIPLTPRVG